MIHWRNRLTAALAAVGATFLLLSLFSHPHPMPTTAARYKVAAPPIAPKAERRATAGVTYAIDSLEADGQQHPITGATLARTDTLVLHGWAVSPESLTPGQVLYVSVDGRPKEPDPSYGTARPDVGAAINPAATRSGFNASIKVRDLKPGLHRIQLTLQDGIGRQVELPTPVSFTLR